MIQNSLNILLINIWTLPKEENSQIMIVFIMAEDQRFLKNINLFPILIAYINLFYYYFNLHILFPIISLILFVLLSCSILEGSSEDFLSTYHVAIDKLFGGLFLFFLFLSIHFCPLQPLRCVLFIISIVFWVWLEALFWAVFNIIFAYAILLYIILLILL